MKNLTSYSIQFWKIGCVVLVHGLLWMYQEESLETTFKFMSSACSNTDCSVLFL